MKKVSDGTNCQVCTNCQRMIDYREIHTPYDEQISVSWRCYGQSGGAEMKRDICEGKYPPEIAPFWCPNRDMLGSLNTAYQGGASAC